MKEFIHYTFQDYFDVNSKYILQNFHFKRLKFTQLTRKIFTGIRNNSYLIKEMKNNYRI